MRLFFLVLCVFFLNTFYPGVTYSSDEPAKVENLELVPTLVLSDYNSGTLYTNRGSLTGGDEEAPGTTYTALIPDDNFARGNAGYSLMLDYNVSGLGEFSFYWMKLGKELSDRSNVTAPLDLRNYNYLSFWIKGLNGAGNIKIELHQDIDNDGMFIFGRDLTSSVYAGSYMKEERITDAWQKVLIPLRDFSVIKDWSKMLELVFVFENKGGNKKGALYVDDILFGRRPENLLTAEDLKALNAPHEPSFKVNGLTAKQCLAFTRSNKLAIKADSLKENPFIESLSFEYTTDNGTTWRTIGTDYDTSDGLYEVPWIPEDGGELYSYKVRALVSDIRGNRKETGTLIDCGIKPLTDYEFLNLVEKKAFKFFHDHQSLKTGLFADTSGGGDASIASTGFGITALCVGAKRGWIDKEEAKKRVTLALDAFLPQAESGKPLAEGKYGFFYHFLDVHTGERAGKSEISTVDTAILVCGAITAGEYFGSEIKKKAEELYERVEWGKFLSRDEVPWRNMFSMGWSPERGFLDSFWDYYTDEAILICLLAIGSPTHPVSPDTFYTWSRHENSYDKGKPFIYSWHGALFSYQYAHVWFDFRNIVDKEGVNWFENSTNATLANRQFCIDHEESFKAYGPDSWGITSMARPNAYTMHFGVPPTGSGEPQYDGTISPTGPAGSIIFTPFLSLKALKYMYLSYPELWGKYGFRDSFNLDLDWYAHTYYGIGEAMYILPVENFRSGFIWEEFMKNQHVKNALKRAGFTKTVRKGRKRK